MDEWHDRFRETVDKQIAAFSGSRFFALVDSGRVRIEHYHALLCTLFHQTRNGPYTFAMAGAMCPWRHERVKEYLIQHAEEERTHWRWVLDDLKSTAYAGPDPTLQAPHPTCLAYVALNELVALRTPVARLAAAAVLEGIGARYGGTHGPRMLAALRIGPANATFFTSHGETDKVHIEELGAVIYSARLDPDEQAAMINVATTAGKLYRDMYDHEAYA